MGKRVAYIGLSGPIGYDYKNKLNWKFPNPILEGPLGIMVLYDEMVFLDKVICPKSMQELDFVRFLSDSRDMASYLKTTKNEFYEGKILTNKESNLFYRKLPFREQENRVKSLAPFATYDNHSRQLYQSGVIPRSPDLTNVNN